MTMGEIIQTGRAKRGLSQEKLAELVGVSRQAVSKWEVGDAVPDTDKLVPLACGLGITTDELLGNVPEEQKESGEAGPMLPNKPGWFATHWYWLGLVLVAWGGYLLLQLIIMILGILML
ncbi:hypothetical protein N510_000717 [Firmicutes bacterium ASF500]|nr:hypothetical protein N510_000717 [Firmicutes bacterium ASF500]